MLHDMVDKTFVFKNSVYTIIDLKIETGAVNFVTDKGPLRLLNEEIKTELKEIPTTAQALMAMNIQKEMDASSSIVTILTDTIKKTQENPGYVAQAKEINASVKNLIDLKRAQIEMVSLLKH